MIRPNHNDNYICIGYIKFASDGRQPYPILLYLQKEIVKQMDNKNPLQKTVVGVQFLFVAFGATVLSPYWLALILLPPFLQPVSAR